MNRDLASTLDRSPITSGPYFGRKKIEDDIHVHKIIKILSLERDWYEKRGWANSEREYDALGHRRSEKVSS